MWSVVVTGKINQFDLLSLYISSGRPSLTGSFVCADAYLVPPHIILRLRDSFASVVGFALRV